MLWCVIICLIVGGVLGYVTAALMVAAKGTDKPDMNPLTTELIHALCKGGKIIHVWVKDEYGVFPAIAGETGRDGHIEAACSLKSFVNYLEPDYGTKWFAFSTKEAAEGFSWSLS